MSTGTVTPWNVLSDAITKKIGTIRERAQKAKDQETQTEYKAWEGILNNPASTEEERQAALDHMKKTVPKEAIPIVEGYHKVVSAVHKMRQKGKQGQGQGQVQGQPQPQAQPQPQPSAAPQAGNSAGAGNGLTLPKALSNVAARSPVQAGQAEGQQEAAKQAEVTKAKREAAEDTIKAIEARGLKVPDEVKAEILSQPTGAIPAGVMRPKASANAPKKAPKVNYGPGGQFRGVTDPEDKENDQPGAEYPSRALIPPDRKDLLALFDAGKAEADKEQAAELDKERRKMADMADMIGKRVDAALKESNYKEAKKEVNKTQSLVDDSIDRMSTMDANLRDMQEGAKAGKPNQQAMLSLVANHIGMTLGAQKGARITRAIWDEATQSAPWLQRIEAKWSGSGADSYLTGVVITPEQADQMVALGHEKVDILKSRLDRVKEEHADDLELAPAVPRSMKGPKSKSTGTSKSKEEQEDEQFLQKF